MQVQHGMSLHSVVCRMTVWLQVVDKGVVEKEMVILLF